jgi:hypothetical protein
MSYGPGGHAARTAGNISDGGYAFCFDANAKLRVVPQQLKGVRWNRLL